MDKNVKWAHRYTELAQTISEWSEDGSTKVGAVIVQDERIVSVGYNGFCRGVDQTIPARHERPTKYLFFEHAERNAVYNAGRDLHGATMYLNFHPCPCADCTRAVIQSGIRTVIGADVPFNGAGKGVHYDVDDAANIMMEEAGIERFIVRDCNLVPYKL